MKAFYLSGNLLHSRATEEHIALSYFRTGIKKEHETKAPCLFEKEVSISPERSKRFRKTPASFCRKQGAPTRKARLSDPKRAFIEPQKVHLRALWLPICPLKKKVHVSRNSHSAPF